MAALDSIVSGGSPTALATAFVLAALLAPPLLDFVSRYWWRRLFGAGPSSSSQPPAAAAKPAAKRPVVKLSELRTGDEVPERLRTEFYFDAERLREYEHASLIDSSRDVIEVLDRIHSYALGWLAEALEREVGPTLDQLSPRIKILDTMGCRVSVQAFFEPDTLIGKSAPTDNNNTTNDGAKAMLIVAAGCMIKGGVLDVSAGNIYLGEGVEIEPGVVVKGPAIIGKGCKLRPGAFLRGDCVLGRGAVVRCEMKNAILMDEVEVAHPGYVGDSILGYKAHFGCQSLTANLGLLGGNCIMDLPAEGGGGAEEEGSAGRRVDVGRRKVGAVLGDHSQLGCNSVTEPGCLLGPNTVVYPLSRMPKGVYGPSELIKNKPLEHGVIERSPFR